MATKTVSEKFFEENVVENKKELIEVGELANRILHDKLSIELPTPYVTIAIYAKVFETICDVVADKESEWDDFALNVADRVRVGYTTTNNEDDEKSGNFMVFIQHINNTQTDESLDDEETETVVLCTQWNAANVKAQADVIKDVASRAKKVLSEMINIKFESHEFIIPMFCIIHSQIINYIRLKRVETQKSEYELNIAGLFTIGIQENEDAEEEIYYVPSISLKLRFKNDAQATGKDE